MAKTHTRFVCQSCAYESPKWIGRCPDCGQWASMVEETVEATKPGKQSAPPGTYAPPTPITDLSATGATRTSTGISEFDRVLGGGVVAGSLVLIGGDPGIGKSTLLIEAAVRLAQGQGSGLY